MVTKYKNLEGKKMYENEELNSFFRRLAFSPDSKLLLTPTGINIKDQDETTHCVYGYHTEYLKSGPFMLLNNFKKATICVKFSPLCYESSSKPYKFVYGVATLDEIVFYDTDSDVPLGLVGKLHYGGITDFSWSLDGEFIVISSGDGFCSVVQFDVSEFGTVIEPVTDIEATAEAELMNNASVDKQEDVVMIENAAKTIGDYVPDAEVIKPAATHDEPSNIITSNIDGSKIDLTDITTLGNDLIKKKR